MTDTYSVRPGDSLWHIARNHGVTVGELLVANPRLSSPGRSADHLAPGETIALPPATGFSKAADLKSGTTTCEKEQIRRKNIIFVGSEMYYDSFWLKMMFIAPAVTVASGPRLLRTADETAIAYVDEGYTFLEKLPLEAVAKQFGHKIVRLADSAGVAATMNDLPVTEQDGCTILTKLQDVVFFCHGTPGRIGLNYSASTNAVDLSSANYTALNTSAFVPDGKLFSYACRTGTGVRGNSFRSDAEAKPELSLAQKLADHLRITVFAFLTRTWYGEALRNPADSATMHCAQDREGRTCARGHRAAPGARSPAASGARRGRLGVSWHRRAG